MNSVSQIASYIPPFLHNFYNQLSANDQLFATEPSMQVYKGFFDEISTDTQHTITFPSLYSDMFFNFTFERAELRVWYKCSDISEIQTSLYIEISSNQLPFKHRTQITCQMIDENNQQTQHGWSVFDITELMKTLQTTEQNALKNQLTFSIETSSRLVKITKQIFSSKYSPSHLPLLALYNDHVMKHVEPRDVSMRYLPYTDETVEENDVESKVREVRASSSCSRVSQSMKVEEFLKIMRTNDYNFVYPTTFDFGYCKGYCPFKLINHHNGTTHAQIMNNIAQRHHKPRYAKCVPASYKNLYILLSNIVDEIPITSIRGYRDTIVGYCGCR
nr:BMPLc [Oopsacas minuta]